MNRREWKQLLLVIGAVLVGVIVGGAVFTHSVAEIDEVHIPITVRGELNPAKLYVRSIPPGGVGVRVLLLENAGERKLMHIRLSGDQAAWAEMEQQWILLAPSEHRAHAVRVRVPPETAPGNYSITATTIAYRITI